MMVAQHRARPQVRRPPAPRAASRTARASPPRLGAGGPRALRRAPERPARARRGRRGRPRRGGRRRRLRRPDPGHAARRGRPGRPGGLRGLGLRRAHRRGLAAVTLVEGEPLLDAARVGAHAISAELGGLSPGKFHAADLVADALHGALGRAAHAQAALAPDPGRTLVAMSGGVDSAVAALLAGEGAVAVTLELWADPENDAEASCCSAHAVRVARSVAHGMGMPHFTLDLREPFRAGVVDPFLAGLRGRRDAEPVRRLQRPRAPRRDGRVRRPARRGRPGHGPLRARDGRRAAARRRRPGQGPDLHARRRRAGDARAAALPARRADQAAGARAGRRGRAARGLQGRVAGPVLPGRHRQGRVPGPPRRPRRPPRRDRRPRRHACSRCTAARTTSRSASARASASPRRSRCTCSPPTCASNRVVAGPREALATHVGRAARRPAAPGGGRGRRRQAALPLAPAALPGGRRARPRPGRARAARARSTAPRPGQTACLLRGDVVVGWGTIART